MKYKRKLTKLLQESDIPFSQAALKLISWFDNLLWSIRGSGTIMQPLVWSSHALADMMLALKTLTIVIYVDWTEQNRQSIKFNPFSM